MKIGVLSFVASYTADPGAIAKHCEALGFESFYLPEHPILPVKHKTRYPLSPDGARHRAGRGRPVDVGHSLGNVSAH